jgi:hypothetical protein
VLLGALVGFGAMCGLGRYVAHLDYHPGFVRFIPMDAPSTRYYPTVNEMMSIVRGQIKPGQILVVVGGNSVLLGIGQPPENLWTKRLQEDLGSGYCVVNFAFRGEGVTNGGAVVAEAIRKEYPRQILIANLQSTLPGYPTGSEWYRYNNWEAYYKGLLVDDSERSASVKRSNADGNYANLDIAVPELRLREWLDGLFYFQDLWNYFTFTKVNTVWASYLVNGRALSFLRPRSLYVDAEPDYLTMPMSERYPEAQFDGEMASIRGISDHAISEDVDEKWQPNRTFWNEFERESSAAFPGDLKKRTLILLGYDSPVYLSRLTRDESRRHDLLITYSAQEWEKCGYEALVYGKEFTVDDDGDRLHLTWHGGVKLAQIVATRVRAMSRKLGYVEPPSPPSLP